MTDIIFIFAAVMPTKATGRHRRKGHKKNKTTLFWVLGFFWLGQFFLAGPDKELRFASDRDEAGCKTPQRCSREVFGSGLVLFC